MMFRIDVVMGSDVARQASLRGSQLLRKMMTEGASTPRAISRSAWTFAPLEAETFVFHNKIKRVHDDEPGLARLDFGHTPRQTSSVGVAFGDQELR